MATAYCMKCRKKVEIKNPKQITLKNGRPAFEPKNMPTTQAQLTYRSHIR